MDIKLVIALNMYDELEKRGDIFDYKHLAEMTGVPIVPMVAPTGKGIDHIIRQTDRSIQRQRPSDQAYSYQLW